MALHGSKRGLYSSADRLEGNLFFIIGGFHIINKTAAKAVMSATKKWYLPYVVHIGFAKPDSSM